MSLSASVLINNHNYGRFIEEAVTSALHQTSRPLEVIVVDDGSTDDSAAIISRAFGSDPTVKLVTQPNAGQLSAFVSGLERARGDVVLFLDADDRYEPFHVEQCLEVLGQHRGVDFAFTGHRQFGASDRICQLAPRDRLLGFSAARTLFRGAWIGSVTSTLALRRPLTLALLPALRALVPRWRIRADDCLVVGASLAGAQKYFIARPSVAYRTHGANHFHGRRSSSEADDYAHWLRRDSLIAVMARELGIRRSIGLRAEVEFRSVASPTPADYADYVALVRSLDAPLAKRWKMRVHLWRHFRRPPATRLAAS